MGSLSISVLLRAEASAQQVKKNQLCCSRPRVQSSATEKGHFLIRASQGIFLEIMLMKVRDKEDISYILDRQRLNSAKVLAVGWIHLLLRNDKIAEGLHLITAPLIAPLDLGLCADVQLLSNE